MYRDPSKRRTLVVKLRFTEEEHELLEALTEYTGDQKAVVIRRLALAHAAKLVRGSKKNIAA